MRASHMAIYHGEIKHFAPENRALEIDRWRSKLYLSVELHPAKYC